MCVFLLKQVISSYVLHKSPVYATFIDASKAFNRVNHGKLFQKLEARNVPTCFVRLLKYWYSAQSMKVKWANCVSQSFKVTNGVRQGGVLSPYLFSLYMEELSEKLNNTPAGCCLGNLSVNHLMYADDICCFSSSACGLQDLLDVCTDYAKTHEIVFNCKKTVGVLFCTKDMNCFQTRNIKINNSPVKFVSKVSYLGVYLKSNLRDDEDIARQVRCLYCAANKLKARFAKCSTHVKNILFRAHCMGFYASQLWCNYSSAAINRLRVAYNDAFRILHGLPRYYSAGEYQVQYNIPTFYALLRKNMYRFVQRCYTSANTWISALMTSDSYYASSYYKHYCNAVYMQQE